MREKKTNEEEVPDCGPTIGGIAGVTNEIRGLLAEIGLKHVKVTPEGNCFYLAFSKGMYGKSSKWKEVRNKGADHIENNVEFYKGKLEDEEILSTPAEMRKSGIFADDLSLLAVSEAYRRPIEVWRRTPSGDEIETQFDRPPAEGSILLWYNGVNLMRNGHGNHYDALIVVDEEKFKRREEKCMRLSRRRMEAARADTLQKKGETQRTDGSDGGERPHTRPVNMESKSAGLVDLDMRMEPQDEGGKKLGSSNEGIETILKGTNNETEEYESGDMEEERRLGNVMEESQNQEDGRTNTGNAILKMAKIQTTKEDSIRLETSPLPAGYDWVNGVLQEDEQGQSPMQGEDLTTDNRKRLNEQLSELSDSEDSHVSKSKGIGTDNIIKQSSMSTQKIMDENFL